MTVAPQIQDIYTLSMTARLALESGDLVLVETLPGPGLAGIVVSVQAGSIGPEDNIGILLELMDPEYGATCRIRSPYLQSISRLGPASMPLSEVDSKNRMSVVRSPRGFNRLPGIPCWVAVHPVYPPETGALSMDDNDFDPAGVSVSAARIAEAVIAAATALAQRCGSGVEPAIDYRPVAGVILALGGSDGIVSDVSVLRALATLRLAAQEAAGAATVASLSGAKSADQDWDRVHAGASVVQHLAESAISMVAALEHGLSARRSTAPTPESAVDRDAVLRVIDRATTDLEPHIGVGGLVADEAANLEHTFWTQFRTLVGELPVIPESPIPMVATGLAHRAIQKAVESAQDLACPGDPTPEQGCTTEALYALATQVVMVLTLPCAALESEADRRAALLDSLEPLSLPEIARAIAHLAVDERLSIMAALYARAKLSVGSTESLS